MEAIIVIGRNVNLLNYNLENKILIGVENGAYLLFEHGYKNFTALGDFDSLDSKKISEMEKSGIKIIKLNPIKDVTDSFYAYLLANKCEKITFLGGIQGKRIEHFLALLNIVKTDKRVILLDDNTFICSSSFYNKDKIDFAKDKYRFYSFFAITDSVISLKGFKYPLDKYNLNVTDSLCISNEIVSNTAILEIIKGSVLIIKSILDR